MIAQRTALLEDLPAARDVLRHLEEQYSIASFHEESDNLDQLQELVARLDQRITEVRAAVGKSYYRAVVLALDDSLQLLAEGRAYLEELGAAEDALAATRERVKTQLETCRKQAEDANRQIDEAGLGEELRAEIRRLDADLLELEQGAAEAKPDWPALEPRTARVAELLDDLGPRLEAARESWRQALAERTALTARVDELQDRVRRETRERVTVSRAAESVAAELATWSALFDDPASEGVEMLEEAGRVTSRLAWAERLWREEIDLIRRVETELQGVQSRLQQEDGRRFGHGVQARCDAARRSLDEARRAAGAREWEEAARLVQTGREEIERELKRCRREERRIEQQRRAEARARERERRARLAATAVQVGVFGHHVPPLLREARAWGGVLPFPAAAVGAAAAAALSAVPAPGGRAGETRAPSQP